MNNSPKPLVLSHMCEKDHHVTDHKLLMASMNLDIHILVFLIMNLPKKEGVEGAYDYRACKLLIRSLGTCLVTPVDLNQIFVTSG